MQFSNILSQPPESLVGYRLFHFIIEDKKGGTMKKINIPTSDVNVIVYTTQLLSREITYDGDYTISRSSSSFIFSHGPVRCQSRHRYFLSNDIIRKKNAFHFATISDIDQKAIPMY